MKKRTGSMVAYLNNVTRQAASTLGTIYTVQQIDVRKIIPNQKNFYSMTGIEELANSFAVSDRQIPPLDVVDNGDGTYRLISGERRLSATLLRIKRGEITHAELPCHVLPAFRQEGSLTAGQMETLSIILANNYRQKTVLDRLREIQELEPIAKVIYQEAKEKGELADEKGANMKFRTFFAEHILSISKSALQRLQSLMQLTDEAKAAFEEGLIGKSVATELASLSKEEQNTFVASVRAGEISGTRADLEAHLKASNPETKAEEIYFGEETMPQATVSDRMHESTAEDVALADAQEVPDHPKQQEKQTGYDDTIPTSGSCASADMRDACISVKESPNPSDVFQQTQDTPIETLLEEASGRDRLLTDDMCASKESDASTAAEGTIHPNKPITAPEAVKILLALSASMNESGRTREVDAIDFVLDAMEYRYTWISAMRKECLSPHFLTEKTRTL